MQLENIVLDKNIIEFYLMNNILRNEQKKETERIEIEFYWIYQLCELYTT